MCVNSWKKCIFCNLDYFLIPVRNKNNICAHKKYIRTFVKYYETVLNLYSK